ncbi:uncharacterized protein [Leuresthes tenuis]|uniref:uncharacterized protein isoform X2 n=1 Tax=Leuresthes tenuis TaxID=355514 RepID=UPI003B502051
MQKLGCGNFCRPHIAKSNRRGGGVAVLFNESFQCKQLSPGSFQSFEYMAIQLKASPRVLFLNIYRPPKYCADFSEDLSELLSMICVDFDCIIIVGDFNIHMDNPQDRGTKDLSNTLDNFGLTQHITEPTHNRGHTLDLVISKGLSISKITVSDVGLSDHSCVFFESTISVHTNVSTAVISKQCITENSSKIFNQVFSLTPALSGGSVSELVSSFNTKMLNVMDTIAPIKVKVISGRKKSPWRNSTLVKNGKRECRKAERRWRKTNLQVHYDIYKEKLHSYNLQLRNARKSYFSDIITKNSHNAQALFATVDRLTNPPVSVANELHSTMACNDFAKFFIDKVQNIRQAVGTSAAGSAYVLCPPKTGLNTMTLFQPINSKDLEDILRHLKSSSCCLDILPTGFFKGVSKTLESDLLLIVNLSLTSGVFPEPLKTAVIKPLLKKDNLDKTQMNNYRPISNLPFISKIIEKAVFQQLNYFLTQNNCYDTFQSGFRQHHSTETALTKVFNDICLNTEWKNVSLSFTGSQCCL